jgi:hypothetical protein
MALDLICKIFKQKNEIYTNSFANKLDDDHSVKTSQ